MANSIFAWPMAVYSSDYREILKLNVDGYFFVRFLHMMGECSTTNASQQWLMCL